MSWTVDDTNGPTTLEVSLLEQAVTARRRAAYAQRGEVLVAVFAGAATLSVAGAHMLAVTVGPARQWRAEVVGHKGAGRRRRRDHSPRGRRDRRHRRRGRHP